MPSTFHDTTSSECSRPTGSQQVLISLVTIVLFVFLCFWWPMTVGTRQASAIDQEGSVWVNRTMKSLDLEHKVGQLLQIRYYADYKDFEDPEYIALRNQIQKYHVGSLVLYIHGNSSGLIRVSPVEAARVANQLQHDSELPLLLAGDIER